MTDHVSAAPWEQLAALIAVRDAASAERYLHDLPAGEVARTLSRLSEDDQRSLLDLLGPQLSADLIEHLSSAQAVEIIEELTAANAAAILEEIPSADRVDLLADLESADAAAILDAMPVEQADDARRLLQYPEDTAGGVMITEYLSFAEHLTVGDVVEDMRAHGERYSDYDIQYAYVTDAERRLAGVLRLRDLLLARTTQTVGAIMMRDPLSVPDNAGLTDLKQVFDDHAFVGVPVTNAAGQLMGVVRRAAVLTALGEQATEAFLAVTGLIGEELRTMPLGHRSRRRLSWLSINIVLNVIAASVIAMYQDTLAAVIALAVFLPIISDMSGCSGNQAVAVSIRELALGLVKPHEFVRVAFKEGAVGILNGLVLGVLLGAVAVLWKGNLVLGLVVGTALALNTIIAVLLGGLIPLVLRGLKHDPALASGPILTTVTDMVGFFLVLSFASAMLPLLT
ncbi:MAG: magnesium transporter [Gemmatimonadota bacterium]|nr:magnesium transporter [Gemmatimonadota bacterium]MDH3479995.1 magnesium transporter [Gemmatimonadota bacterium]MDH3569620.1 magnesium transporter [Gemmatimonadota bacterium]MDH5550421.1 magnesium transporter [Gemmatimonadota bacterium]